MLWKTSSEEAFRRCGRLLNSASLEEVVRPRIYIHYSSYVRRFVWWIMAALPKYVKQWIISLKERDLTNREVVAILKREGDMVHVTTQIVWRCHKRYVEIGGSIARREGSGRPTLRTAALLQTIEDIMQADDETTAAQIRSYCSEARGCYHSARFCVHDVNWAGRTEGQCTANLFARQTQRSVLKGLVLTFMTIFRMFCGQMNRLYN